MPLACNFLVPPGRFERPTPALGGRVQSCQLGLSDFMRFHITARKTTFFLSFMLTIRLLVHPYFTPYALAGVKFLR